jgi:hypothetical protein
MKKALFLFALLLGFTLSLSAQRATLMPLVEGDTVVNAASVSKTFTVTAGYSAVAVQPVITKISGTVGGSAILYYSLDGTNFSPAGDTLTLANVTTNSKVFAKVTAPGVYYRVTTTGTGTMSAQVRIYYLVRKHD